MRPDIVVLDHVSAMLGGRMVLEGVDARIARGEFVALLGPNGAGKSTVAKVMAGLVAPSSGRVEVDGRPLAALGPAGAARALAYLPQVRAIHWPMSVRAIVALGRLPLQSAGASSPARDAAAVDEALAEMAIVDLADRPVLALSGGEQARVLMARALAQEADVLVADEPTAALDLRHQLDMMRALAARARNGTTVIAALHDLALAARFADRVLMLSGGHIVADGPPADVLRPELLTHVYGVEMVLAQVDGVPVFVAH